MKAILMTNAQDLRPQRRAAGTRARGDVDDDYRWLWTQPLDDHQGARPGGRGGGTESSMREGRLDADQHLAGEQLKANQTCSLRSAS
jgi:hypothetical protein